ncbi:hypothetical protein DEO72_LG9g1774 [Vigna unguiculata]|uniref:Uncharacterized protein n=1 Tax=Vigna unguiculata TaxID=3917 RepID=A0A4D6MYY5_VIGUN|nr:hypothetical protein DEO72_LG9g1774 [Vigna unguiculata]
MPAEGRVVPDGSVLACVMAHHVKKVGGEVDLFAKIRDKMANAAKGEGQLQAPNLVGLVVDSYRPPVAKRPAPSKMKGVGKDRKRLRALAKTDGVGSNGSKKKLKAKQVELDGVNAAKDAAAEEAASEVFGLQQAVYNEHANGFRKALRN